MNAPQLAAERGLIVRETSSSSARDYVNLVELRGRTAERSTHVAGTLYGKQDAPRIVAIDDHIVDIAAVEPHARRAQRRHARDDRASSARSSATPAINIDELDLGSGPTGDAALMVLSTSTPVPADGRRAAARRRRASSTPRRSSSTRASVTLPSRGAQAVGLGRPPAESRVAAVGLGARRSSRRPARGRSRSSSLAFTGCDAGHAPSFGSTHAVSRRRRRRSAPSVGGVARSRRCVAAAGTGTAAAPS